MSAKQFAYSPLAAGIGELRSSWDTSSLLESCSFFSARYA
jgi:hypothetical protein